MINIDTVRFPLVEMQRDSNMTLEDADSYIEGMNQVLDRNLPFGLLILGEENLSEKTDPQVSNRIARWLKEKKPFLALYCRGIANITASEEYHAKYKSMLEKQGLQIYGCPVQIFLTLEEGEKWLLILLAMSSDSDE